MTRPKMLLVTTRADLSLGSFYQPHSAALIEPHHIFFNSSEKELRTIFEQDFDFLYVRDPFNDSSVSREMASNNTELVVKRYSSSYRVDGISSFKSLLLEDKWYQYKLFRQLMPSTKILDSLDSLDVGSSFIKKRISARSKGIVFKRGDFPANSTPSDYIVQPKIQIKKELRVYVVGGKVISPLAVKSSKTPKSRVRITGFEPTLRPEIAEISKEVYGKTKYDLMGLDIAETDSGFVLLEVNRSCQFNGYQRISSVNLAMILNQHLLKNRNQKEDVRLTK